MNAANLKEGCQKALQEVIPILEQAKKKTEEIKRDDIDFIKTLKSG
jgi:hypothetical protein